jgi:aminoglycoside phosphotransferase (APT) family kinase protein
VLIEMHAHTAEQSPCSVIPAVELIRQVFAKGLQGIIFTDHHHFWSDQELLKVRREAQVPDHFLILSGQEVRTPEVGDVLVYGADRSLDKGTPLAGIRVLFPGAALVWAHPYRDGRLPGESFLHNPLLDGIEVFNSNHTVRENSRGLQDWHRHKFTAIGGTDTHGDGYAGMYPTQFDHPVTGMAELAGELKAGRCRPFLKEIPRSGANTLVTEVVIGTKGEDEVRERIIIRKMTDERAWRSADRAFRIMTELTAHGFDVGRYRIPRPIDEDAGSMTLIEESLRGKSLYDRLRADPVTEGREWLVMAARWLAKLHGCRLRLTPSDEFLKKEERRLPRYLERFTDIRHQFSGRVEEIVAIILKEERQLAKEKAGTFVQGHGDYHLKNIFVCQDRVTAYLAAIDFAGSAVMPPAFDVGCFLAQFSNQLHGFPEIRSAYPDDIFLDAYTEAAGGVTAGFRRQVELFRARINLSIAAYLIKVGLGESENLWRLLLETEQTLLRGEQSNVPFLP